MADPVFISLGSRKPHPLVGVDESREIDREIEEFW